MNWWRARKLRKEREAFELEVWRYVWDLVHRGLCDHPFWLLTCYFNTPEDFPSPALDFLSRDGKMRAV